jgi:DNA modification methylase
MCGDWLNDEHRAALMGDEKAALIFTDPPYNADYASRVDKGRRKEWGGIKNDNMSNEDYHAFIQNVFAHATNHIEHNGSLYACIDWKSYPILAQHLGDLFNHKSTIIWDKGVFGLGTYYRTQYEMILFCSYGDKIVWNADHDEKDVWTISREILKDYVHPTQKPVAIPERAILNSSNNGDLVLDMFCGSGSTMAACQKHGRRCFTIDIDPRYVDVAVKRYQDLTGQKAINQGTGELFDDIKGTACQD